MKLDQLRMLRQIADLGKHALYRNLIDPGAGLPTSISAHIIDQLEQAGHVERTAHHVRATDLGLQALAQADAVTPPRTIVNASSGGIYRPSWAPMRPGAQDFMAVPSRGIEARGGV